MRQYGYPALKPKWKPRVRLIEADTERFVVDNELGRVIIEADSVRFHRAGRGRGRVLVGRDDVE
jgi:hypothetical protein